MSIRSLVTGSIVVALFGCGASPVDKGAPRAQEPAPPRPQDSRMPAPIRASLTGPEAPQEGEALTLDARIERQKPLRVPVQVELVLPAGVTLLEGERVTTLSANTQVTVDTLRYVIRADTMPADDVKLVVHAQSTRFGFHSEQPYRFGRAAILPALAPKDGAELRVGEKSFGRSVDITPR